MPDTQLLLAQALREATRKSHSMAENMQFIRGFLRGVISPEAYCRMLHSYYQVYQEMEVCLVERREHPVCGAIYFPELLRVSAIETDLDYFFGAGWRQAWPVSPATQTYVAHIRRVSFSQPELLVAHAYVRYLGDLSGGQILKRIVERSLGLMDGQGTAFYAFPAIDDHAAFKQRFRAALDALDLTPGQRQEVLDEANRVFALNMDLFAELEGNAWQSLFRTLSPTWLRQRLAS